MRLVQNSVKWWNSVKRVRRREFGVKRDRCKREVELKSTYRSGVRKPNEPLNSGNKACHRRDFGHDED